MCNYFYKNWHVCFEKQARLKYCKTGGDLELFLKMYLPSSYIVYHPPTITFLTGCANIFTKNEKEIYFEIIVNKQVFYSQKLIKNQCGVLSFDHLIIVGLLNSSGILELLYKCNGNFSSFKSSVLEVIAFMSHVSLPCDFSFKANAWI